MLNTVSLQGRLTRDPDLKKTQNNISLVDFNQQQTNHNKGQREQTTKIYKVRSNCTQNIFR